MKRCPKCNRTYPTGNQRFCTNDGELLVVVDAPPADTTPKKFDPDAPTRAISQELVQDQTIKFDPFKTTVAGPVPASEQTSETRGRVTGDLPHPAAPPPAQPQSPSPPSQPVSGPISQPFGEVTSPSMSRQQQSPEPQGPSLPQQTSGSLPPSGFATIAAPPPPQQQTSGSLPPAGVGPSTSPPAFSATLPLSAFTGASQPRQVQPLTAPPPTKKSKLPLVLGILAVLFALGVVFSVAAYIVVPKIIPSLQARRSEPRPVIEPQQNPTEAPNANTTPVQETTATPAENGPPPFSPPANAVQFVNSSDKLDGKLAEHYVEFSFYYPNNWQKDPKAGVAGASNFARVERRLPPDFTQEICAIAWYASSGSFQTDTDLFHDRAETQSSQLANVYPEYRKVSEGVTKVGAYNAYEFRFEGLSRNTAKGDIKLWGRVIFLPPQDGGKSGVTLLMLATSLAPELEGVSDVGEKGELPMILESFRFGRAASQ